MHLMKWAATHKSLWQKTFVSQVPLDSVLFSIKMKIIISQNSAAHLTVLFDNSNTKHNLLQMICGIEAKRKRLQKKATTRKHQNIIIRLLRGGWHCTTFQEMVNKCCFGSVPTMQTKSATRRKVIFVRMLENGRDITKEKTAAEVKQFSITILLV